MMMSGTPAVALCNYFIDQTLHATRIMLKQMMNVSVSENIYFLVFFFFFFFNMQIMSPALVNGHVGGGGGSANAGGGLYSSTQRRGPIAAEFQGPGPAAVALPSTIGNIKEMLSGGGRCIKCESYNLSRREIPG